MTTPAQPLSPTAQDGRPTRRAVARGAAWSVPVVAAGAAAPHASASPCPPVGYTLEWPGSGTSTYTRTSATEGVALVVPPVASAPVVRIDVLAAATGELELTGLNLTVSAFGVGGLSPAQRGLVLSQRIVTAAGSPTPGRDARQALTLSFRDAGTLAPLTVTDVAFTVTDIDSATTPPNDFVDRVELAPAPTSTATGASVTGAGTAGSPFAPTGDDQPLDDTTSSLGNAAVGLAGPVGAVTLTYWNATTRPLAPPDDPIQQVYLTTLSFTVVSDAC